MGLPAYLAGWWRVDVRAWVSSTDVVVYEELRGRADV